jgi:hypothetical protein
MLSAEIYRSRQPIGVLNPLFHQQMKMDLQSSEDIILLLVILKAPQDEAELLIFIFTPWVFFKDDNRLVSFSIEEYCFFDEL